MPPKSETPTSQAIPSREALHIKVTKKKGWVVLRCSGLKERKIGCALRWTQLPDWRQQLGKRLQAVKNEVGSGLKPSKARARKAVEMLQEVGDSWAEKLLGRNLRTFSKLLRKACGWTEEGVPSLCVITLEAELEYTIPLEFLPLFRRNAREASRPRAAPANMDELAAALREFVGFSTIIKRVLPNPGEPRSSVINNVPRLPMKLFVHRGLRGVRREIAFLRRHRQHLDLDVWPCTRKKGSVREFTSHVWHTTTRTDCQPREPDIVDQIHHFATHVHTGHADSNRHTITMAGRAGRGGRAFSASVEEIHAALASLRYSGSLPAKKSRPLVIMNACGTSRIDPTKVSSMPSLFLDHFGCRGFVGTETTIPDSVAANFSEQLYYWLLHGETLGEALHRTRWWLVRNGRNPLGLFYTCYADPDLKLSKPIEYETTDSHSVTPGQ